MSNQFHCLKKQWSAAVAVLVLGAGWASSAQAIGFKLADGAIDGQFDTTLSWGMSMRTEARNRENALSAPPLSFFSPVPDAGTSARLTEAGSGMYGDRAYDEKYDIFINRIKASHDLELTGDGWGAFLRGNYFYDERADNGPELTHSARNKAVNHGDFTDAYIWWRMGPDDQLMVRLGKQVISWGENTFIGWAINDINTVDISQLRVPGVELKDALIGTPALNLSWQATDAISFDAFTLFTYDEVKLDHSGGFFLTNDIFADNMAGFPGVDPITGLTAMPAGTRMAGVPVAGAPICTTPDGRTLGFFGACQTGDEIASGWGQWGAAMHYYAAGLGNGVEFGFFYQSLQDHVFRLGGTAGNVFAGGVTTGAGIGRYYRDFDLEAVERWGWSWNTTLGPWAWGGEYGYRRNDHLQMAPVNTLRWMLAGAATPGEVAAVAAVQPAPALAGAVAANTPFAVGAPAGAKGDFIEDFGHHQLQMTFQRLWGPMPIFVGADQWNTIFEVVHGWVSGMPDRETFPRFDEGLTNNWQGLVARSTHTYNNVLFNRANLDFNLALKWDIRGQSPEFGGTKQFIQDRKQASVGFAFDYRQRWKGAVNYTTFWGAGSVAYKDDQTSVAGAPGIVGGAPIRLDNIFFKDASRDRDFLSFDLSYTF